MYLTQLDTSTLSNQNISSALNVHTFTNTSRLRKIFIDVFAAQLAGNGDYVVYATRQRAGAGAAYEIGSRTTVAVPSGVTSQMFPTIALMCGATDVIKVYVVGLAGDTTTPDIITDVSEEFVLTDASGNVTATNDIPTANQNADALLDRAAGVETSFTLRQAMRLMLASLAGKLAISGNTVTIRDVNDSKDRIVATTDEDGQRTAVTKDVS